MLGACIKKKFPFNHSLTFFCQSLYLNALYIFFLPRPTLNYPFLITLGTFMVFEGATLMVSGFSIPQSAIPEVYLAVGKEPHILIPIFIFIIFVSWFFLRMTEFGNHIYAIGGNTGASRMLGINVKKSC